MGRNNKKSKSTKSLSNNAPTTVVNSKEESVENKQEVVPQEAVATDVENRDQMESGTTMQEEMNQLSADAEAGDPVAQMLKEVIEGKDQEEGDPIPVSSSPVDNLPIDDLGGNDEDDSDGEDEDDSDGDDEVIDQPEVVADQEIPQSDTQAEVVPEPEVAQPTEEMSLLTDKETLWQIQGKLGDSDFTTVEYRMNEKEAAEVVQILQRQAPAVYRIRKVVALVTVEDQTPQLTADAPAASASIN